MVVVGVLASLIVAFGALMTVVYFAFHGNWSVVSLLLGIGITGPILIGILQLPAYALAPLQIAFAKRGHRTLLQVFGVFSAILGQLGQAAYCLIMAIFAWRLAQGQSAAFGAAAAFFAASGAQSVMAAKAPDDAIGTQFGFVSAIVGSATIAICLFAGAAVTTTIMSAVLVFLICAFLQASYIVTVGTDGAINEFKNSSTDVQIKLPPSNSPPDEQASERRPSELRETETSSMPLAGGPIASASSKRNEACPCGSGFKYKHCCGKLS